MEELERDLFSSPPGNGEGGIHGSPIPTSLLRDPSGRKRREGTGRRRKKKKRDGTAYLLACAVREGS